MRGSQQRNTWPHCWVTCRCVCCHQRWEGCRWGAQLSASTVGSRSPSEWTYKYAWHVKTRNMQCHMHRHEYIMKKRKQHMYACVCVDLPCPGINFIAVEVINKAIFVGRQCLIASMNIHTTAGTVIRAAVAVTSLGNGTFRLRHHPRVGPWQGHIYRKLLTQKKNEKIYFY